MKRAKKDRPKAGTFEQSRPGLAPRTNYMLIGTGWLTGQLFRLIDWIER